jgi:hypothetical protein
MHVLAVVDITKSRASGWAYMANRVGNSNSSFVDRDSVRRSLHHSHTGTQGNGLNFRRSVRPWFH